jgi:hypothetical protein
MRAARRSQDLLAGSLAVAMADAGAAFLQSLAVDLHAEARGARRGGGRLFCHPCLDWSERRPHVAGALVLPCASAASPWAGCAVSKARAR